MTYKLEEQLSDWKEIYREIAKARQTHGDERSQTLDNVYRKVKIYQEKYKTKFNIMETPK